MGFFADLAANRTEQPVDNTPISVLSSNDWGAQQPTLEFDPDTGGMRYVQNTTSYNDYLNSLPEELKQTKEYTANKAQELSDQLFNTFTTNGHVFGGRPNMEAENTAALEEIKKVDPAAYYNAQLSLDLRKAGWDAGQGKTNDITNARIQSNIQDALKAGFDPNQIQSLVANNYANTAQWHATNIAQRQGQGATLQGIEKVAPAFAAMITAGALAPAAAAMEAGAVGAGAAGEIAGGSLYTGAGTFAGEGLGTAAELMGPTYGELGITGVEGGFAGPTYGEMGYTGLNQQATIDAANAASQGSQALDALNYANKARNLMGLGTNIGKLLGIGGTASAVGGATGGSTGGSTGGTATGTGGLSPQQLAKYLYNPAPVQASPVPYQIKMNQNPFTFDIPGQTKATEGMYDVSGVNPMANALRKNNGTNS
jgi:hypothetical protein